MIRFIKNQTERFKSLLVGPMSTTSNDLSLYRVVRDLGMRTTRWFPQFRQSLMAPLAALAFILPGSISIGHAEVQLGPEGVRVGDIPVDLRSLGSETSDATMACWQGGKEIFSADEFNTVLLGGLAGETAITLKNNSNGTQALAISLENGLCFVTIAP